MKRSSGCFLHLNSSPMHAVEGDVRDIHVCSIGRISRRPTAVFRLHDMRTCFTCVGGRDFGNVDSDQLATGGTEAARSKVMSTR
jgi:hypothetical protein